MHVITDKAGTPITGGTSYANKKSTKPHSYTSHRGALSGLSHLTKQHKEELEVTPYAPLDDLMGLAFLCAGALQEQGHMTNSHTFLTIMGRYDYTLNDVNELVHKSEV